MIRVVERDEALGMARGLEYLGRVLDAHDVVPRRVKDEQCFVQIPERSLEILYLDIVEELLLDPESAPGDLYLRFAGRLDFRPRAL